MARQASHPMEATPHPWEPKSGRGRGPVAEAQPLMLSAWVARILAGKFRIRPLPQSPSPGTHLPPRRQPWREVSRVEALHRNSTAKHVATAAR